MNINPVFFDVFGTWFDADTLDDFSRETLQAQAGFSASALSGQIDLLDELVQGLSEFLETWDSQNILKLIEVSNVDWLADKSTEADLRFVINEILHGLKFYARRQP